jgi:transposase
VRRFAVDHTFKETAKRFGIHHSTVSGWVKESEKQDKAAPYGDSGREKGEKTRFTNKRKHTYRDT